MFEQLINRIEDWVNGRPVFGDFGDRSPQWRRVRNLWILENPFCAVCGYQERLNVHHIKPFHLFPELELDPTNFITLGEACPTGNHHLLFGHLGKWESYNADVRRMAYEMNIAIKSRPERKVAQ